MDAREESGWVFERPVGRQPVLIRRVEPGRAAISAELASLTDSQTSGAARHGSAPTLLGEEKEDISQRHPERCVDAIRSEGRSLQKTAIAVSASITVGDRPVRRG